MTCPDRAPALWPENVDAWRVWQFAGTQWRASGFGLVGLDWPAVRECATWLGIDIRIPRVRDALKRLECERLALQAKPKDQDHGKHAGRQHQH